LCHRSSAGFFGVNICLAKKKKVVEKAEKYGDLFFHFYCLGFAGSKTIWSLVAFDISFPASGFNNPSRAMIFLYNFFSKPVDFASII
jgi:hypothetical protein